MVDHFIGILLLIFGISSSGTAAVVLGDEITYASTSAQSKSTFGVVQMPIVSQNSEQQKQSAIDRLLRAEITYKKAHEDLRSEFTDAKDLIRSQSKNPGELRQIALKEKAAFEELVHASIARNAIERASQRQVFDTKVSTFTDKSKQQKVIDLQNQIIVHADARIQELTSQFDLLQEILVENIIYITQSPNFKSMKRFNFVVKDALFRIEETKVELLRITQRTYIIDVTSESNSKNDVLWTLSELDEDISYTLKILYYARMAVKESIQERTFIVNEKYPGNITK
jgi:hypothetical protein